MSEDAHRYYANAIGAVAFFACLTFGIKSCNDHAIETEKTEQIQIIYSAKK